MTPFRPKTKLPVCLKFILTHTHVFKRLAVNERQLSANPIVKFYDPLNLAEADFWGQGNEATIGFLRHSEIKHGRVAMAAFVGYIIQAQGIHWPWPMSFEQGGYPSGQSPAEQWDSFNSGGKWQLMVVISLLELWDECGGGVLPHYMNGRTPGQYPPFTVLKNAIGHPLFNLYDPFGLNKNMSPEKAESGLVKEINNGRLAMIGIFGFLAESKVTGSVPALTSLGIKHYDGDYMVPFEGAFSYFH